MTQIVSPLENLRQPQFCSNGYIRLVAELDGDTVDFVAAPDDCTDYGPAIYAAAMSGAYGEVAAYVPPSAQEVYDFAATEVRYQRDQRLAKCDWTQLPDVPVATQELWAVYRQALRDISYQAGFPFTVDWPVEPTQG